MKINWRFNFKTPGIKKLLNYKRRLQAKRPIIWKGDLSDDCTAEWAGLMLRAEWMDKNYWWWAVYDMKENEITIDSSNEHKTRCIGGEAARTKAESAARLYLGFES